MKRGAIVVLKVAILAILLGYLARSLWQDREDLKKLALLRDGLGWLALAQVFIAAMLSLTFIRWRLLLQAQGIEYRYREAFALGFIGFFFNQFIPGSTGGDLIKAYYVAIDHPQRRAAGITTVFLDRVVGLLVLVAIAAVAIVLNWTRIAADPVLRSLAVLVAGILAGSLAAGALFFSSRLRAHPATRALLRRVPFHDLLMKIQGAVYLYRFHPRLVLVVLMFSLAVQLSVVSMGVCYAMALGGGGDPATFFFIVPLGNLAMSIPTGSPGGLGQSEFTYRELFERVGYPHGLLLALLQRVNWGLWALVGGVFYFRRKGQVERARRLAGEAAGLEMPAAATTGSQSAAR